MKIDISQWRSVLSLTILIILGLLMIIGGYLGVVNNQKNVELLQNYGLVTQADIQNRTHLIDLSDPDRYEISYGFQAQSPSDGKLQMYSKRQPVSREIFNSIEGCESLLERYVPGCEIKDIGPNDEIVLVCEENYNPDTSECKEATIAVGEENFDVQICEEGQSTNMF